MNLLDLLAVKSNIICLSDLKYSDSWKAAAKTIDATAYSLREWNEAILYLCSSPKQFNTAEEAKAFLMKE